MAATVTLALTALPESRRTAGLPPDGFHGASSPETFAAAVLAERRIDAGDWRRTFSPRQGDGGGICVRTPGGFRAVMRVHAGDPRFADLLTRLVIAVPRHHIVCPERLRGTALAAGGPILLGAVTALLLDLRRRRRERRSRVLGGA